MFKPIKNTAITNAIYIMTKIQLIMKGLQSKSTHIELWIIQIQEAQLVLQQHKVPHPLLEECVQFIIQHLLEPFTLQLETLHNHKDLERQLENSVVMFNYTIKRIALIKDYIPSIVQMDQQDLFCKTSEDVEWVRLAKFVESIDLAHPDVISKEFTKFNDVVAFGCAYAKLGNQDIHWMLNAVAQNYGGFKLLFNIKGVKQQKIIEITNPTVDFVKNLWNTQDNSVVFKNFMKCTIASIGSHHKIYIPYLFSPTFTKDRIAEEINTGTLYEIEKFDGFNLNEDNLFDRISEPLCNKRNQQNKIKIRILSANKKVFRNHIDYSQIVQQVQNISKTHHQISQQTNQPINQQSRINKIVLQMHGGGWIAMSSFSHQSYTRKWANFMGSDSIIFSVDYRLAPKYPYPNALEDIWQTYLWIIYFAKFYFDLEPNQIVLAGDSAGANMALGICYRAIKMGVRIPDGLLLPYPAVNLNFKMFNPYLLNGLVDQIAPATVLRVVLDEYLKCPTLRPDIDPYLSPLVADDVFLKQLPKIIIMCGQQDSLTGDSIRFTNKLVQLNNDVKLYIINGLSHGFMNFEIPILAVPQMKDVIIKSCELLKELFTSIT